MRPTPAVATWTFDRLKSQPVAITRRAFLRALCAALALRLRPLTTRFTPIADELARLTCWRGCSGPSFAAG